MQLRAQSVLHDVEDGLGIISVTMMGESKRDVMDREIEGVRGPLSRSRR